MLPLLCVTILLIAFTTVTDGDEKGQEHLRKKRFLRARWSQSFSLYASSSSSALPYHHIPALSNGVCANMHKERQENGKINGFAEYNELIVD